MDFLNTALSFPTVIYTVVFLTIIVFWLTTLLGMADVDMLEVDVELEAEGDVAGGSPLGVIGLGDVPVTVAISLLGMFSWLICIYAHGMFGYMLGDGILFYLLGLGLMLLSFALAVPLAVLAARPLGKFFASKEAASMNDMLGLECTLVTGSVTASFGQARVVFRGTEQLVQVRIQDPNHEFKAGDSAVLIEHLTQEGCYLIAPKPWS